MKKFWSVEWIDEEGEQCVRHAHLTDEEADAVMQELCRRGVVAAMHDLTPPQAVDARTAAVLSADGRSADRDKLLGEPS